MHKRQTNKSVSKLMSWLLALSCSYLSFSSALESDRDQELLWSAEGEMNTRIASGIKIIEMSESVIITQGSMEIRGDEATIEIDTNNNEVRRITVIGTPVLYQQQLDTSTNQVKGSSKSIAFYTDETDGTSIVELIGDAIIESPTSNIKCKAIVYIADLDLIRDAPGPCSGVFNSIN